MQIEKKLILCSILAITIGIATIIPLEYLMNAEIVAAAPNAEPWFNVNVPYTYVNLDQSGANDTASWNGVNIQGIANFTRRRRTLREFSKSPFSRRIRLS